MANTFSKNASVTTAVIPAGGLGTRLLPLTKNTPKELLQINDHPMIYYALNELAIAGIKKVIVISAPHKEPLDTFLNIKSYRNNISPQLRATRELLSSLDIQIVHQTTQMGLGDAVSYAEPYIQSEYFLLLLPDEIVFGSPNPSEILIQHWNHRRASYVSIDKVVTSQISSYGIVGFKKDTDLSGNGPWKIDKFVEKPGLDDAPSDMALVGRYLLSKKIFPLIRTTKSGINKEIQLTDALQSHLLTSESFFGASLMGKRFDAGSHTGILETSAYAAQYNC
jgi:UTP--glucose-1-phosphate uridylyltransferase